MKNKIYVTVIIGIMLVTLSFPLKNLVVDSASRKQAVAQKATRVESKLTFDYAVRTEQGNILTSGQIKATKPIKFSEMDKSYLEVEKIREDHNMHTRTVTDSKGHMHTETYWSWDYMGSSTKQSKYVIFMKHKYPAKMFDYSEYEHVVPADKLLKPQFRLSLTGYYYYTASDVRYHYSVVPSILSGCMLANAGENGFKPLNTQKINVHHESIKKLLEDNQQHVRRAIVLFYTGYLILSVTLIGIVWTKVPEKSNLRRKR